MTRKPADLQYGVDDIPTKPVIIVNAVQYIPVLAGFLMFPSIVTHEAQVRAELPTAY